MNEPTIGIVSMPQKRACALSCPFRTPEETAQLSAINALAPGSAERKAAEGSFMESLQICPFSGLVARALTERTTLPGLDAGLMLANPGCYFGGGRLSNPNVSQWAKADVEPIKQVEVYYRKRDIHAFMAIRRWIDAMAPLITFQVYGPEATVEVTRVLDVV